MKTGRNDPCWCGSKLKYKKCHLNRDKQTPVGREKIQKTLNSFNEEKCCSVPKELQNKCTKKIIKAHSVSKSSSLKEIAVNGHVLTTFKVNHDFSRASSHKITPKLIGINKASTFNGFCSHHDKSLFSPIEDQPFEATVKQCFLVAYRAVSRELYAKRSASNVLGLLKDLDKGKSIDEQVAHQIGANYYNVSNDLTSSDLSYIKEKLDYMLIENRTTELVHVAFELESPCSVMTSAILGSEIDFEGNVLQSPSNDPSEIPDYLIVNSFASDGKGYIVLSWLPEHAVSNEILIKQLIKKESISNHFAVFVFTLIENNYLSPVWWESLGEQLQDYLCKIYSYGVSQHTDIKVFQNIPDVKMPKVTKVTTINRANIAL
jgi:hypothetical protein